MKTTYPQYHFRPHKNWINDPNGTIYHNGYYHIFYQYNPTSDSWGNLHWGHTRTKDFINYEVLSDNLYPQKETGETDCFSGCIAINKDDIPVAIYTSVSFEKEDIPNIQKSVFLNEDLTKFDKNRIESIKINQSDLPIIRNDWRDPYVFKVEDRNFLVLGAAIGEKQTPVVLLFENTDGSLTNWKYIKELISFRPVIELFECPNFFKLQNKWVLLGSPYQEVEFYLGSFDVEKLDFVVEKSGVIDHCAQYYATNTIQDDKMRTIIFAFERGFSKDQGWNNVISTPREISINDKNEIIQKPINEIYSLRKKLLINDLSFDLTNVKQFTDENFVQSEINFNLKLKDNLKTNLVLRSEKMGICQILFSQTGVKFDNIFIPFEKTNSIEVKLLIDHSILELFLLDGKHCATRIIESIKDLNCIEFRGNGEIKNLNAYEMGNLNITES
ncbi:MAG: glycoside hydrolase family 32 protein [Bacteroidales bacterium]|nr:glycoside hydrolase family 32 protein [Bacteroidales bacterium]